jgi:hypothetical protein
LGGWKDVNYYFDYCEKKHLKRRLKKFLKIVFSHFFSVSVLWINNCLTVLCNLVN